MSKHTARPWKRLESDDRGPCPSWTIVGNCDQPEHRQSIVARGINDDDDARLIEAAPDLLEAAKAMLRWVDSVDPNNQVELPAADALLAAVEKAEA